MIKAIIWDFGGVLTRYHYYKFQKELAKYLKVKFKMLLPVVTPLLELFNTGKINENEFWKMLAKNLKIKLPRDYKNFIQNDFKKHVKLNHSSYKILQNLKSNYKLALISNVFKPHVLLMEKRGWLKEFDIIVMSCDVGLHKNDERIFLLALNKLGLKGNQCIYIDDRKKHLVPAKNVGMKVVLFKSSPKLKKDLNALLS